jgi:hypothetical protein
MAYELSHKLPLTLSPPQIEARGLAGGLQVIAGDLKRCCTASLQRFSLAGASRVDDDVDLTIKKVKYEDCGWMWVGVGLGSWGTYCC